MKNTGHFFDEKKEAYRIMLLVIWGCRYSEENVWMASGDKVPRVFLFFFNF